MSIFESLAQGQTEQSTQHDETQFILRLPPLAAASLRAALKSGVQNIKDRFSVQFEQDMRNGQVKFDGWNLQAKLMDLPTIVESLKTLDNKTFYKTADISQILICKEESDEFRIDEPEEAIRKTKDGKDKRYLFPHGITKPLKNARKKRFRKMLRKKNVDLADIENEVKRLLRTDNEAKHVHYEIVSIDENTKAESSVSFAGSSGSHSTNFASGDILGSSSFDINSGASAGGSATKKNESIHTEMDLFGDALSSSDDDNE